ncbi:hypothetical protein JNX00_18600 [Hydrogenophaga sp. YM1]|uniref:hypothetical protein n=1 Tax=Hydrogenophaga TaxID=47420 RepID=UPI00086DE6BC|nr:MULTISPECIES: hypothetical protein [unclassified Hydrogenophaga]MBN9372841.1 hypothetical protein [Hydrogenophaga sp.]ODT33506.1 MAG: hypothetical protein ABS53_04550 [Hydrogenophaga sp. SCN 70-13]QRR33629.1 hypothetical protein JNX00_18600 [Hydrogenophaga sp. YM1]
MYLDLDMTTLPATHGMRPTAFGIPPIETLEMLQRLEAEVAMSNLNEMRLIEQQHPDWFERYETLQVEHCSGEELQTLLASAPNAYAKGLVTGALKVRLEMAAVSGLPF